MFVDGKVVMIVGAGPGLGATLARRCAEDGADLVLAARSAANLERIAADARAAGAPRARGPDRRVRPRAGAERSPTPRTPSSVASTCW